MKNHKPLQFIKECPNYIELWEIIDKTITKPMEGLSIEELKYCLYLYIVTGDFKEVKKVLQTNMEAKDIIEVKTYVQSIAVPRTIKYPELLPKAEGLPDELIEFLYCTFINTDVLPKLIVARMLKMVRILDRPIPNLTTLRHSESTADVSSKYDLELAVYKALIDDTAIPTFKLVTKDTESNTEGWITWEGGNCPVDKDTKVIVKFKNGEISNNIADKYKWYYINSAYDIVAYRIMEGYPKYFKDSNECIVKFTGLKIGKVVEQGLSDYPVKNEEEDDWAPHTDSNIWTELPDYKEV